MCGIVTYIGLKRALPILANGLRRMEYRGYDSAGLIINLQGEAYLQKTVGGWENLKERLSMKTAGNSGIAHNRWATHGAPSVENAHPLSDSSKRIWAVHNGIIENHAELRRTLEGAGHVFVSETDSEVLPQLIAYCLKQSVDMLKAIKAALTIVKGAYGIAVLNLDSPDRIWLARLGSPLILGIGKGEMMAASDLKAICRRMKEIVHLQDGDLVELRRDSYEIYRNGERCHVAPELIEAVSSNTGRGTYEHLMIKEIMEQPDCLKNTMRGRLFQTGMIKLGGLEPVSSKLARAKKISLAACGTAFFAALTAKYWFEKYGRIETEVELASEFRYRKKQWQKGEIMLAVSQSGETADTLEAVREAKRRRKLALGIVNVVDSSIARETIAGVYNHIGPEEAVASTKAFTSQLVILLMMAVQMGRKRGLPEREAKRIIIALDKLPEHARRVLSLSEDIRQIVQARRNSAYFAFLGRNVNYPVALEGALKMEEVANVFSKAYAGGEMKHGPLSMVDENMTVVYLCPSDRLLTKNLSNIHEIASRGGYVIAVTDRESLELNSLCKEVIMIPRTHPAVTPILNALPLQLFAYYAGVDRGKNVDRPRHLAKAVTVE